MIYDFNKEYDIQKHDIYIERAKRLKKKVRTEGVSQKRSLKINAYLHVLIQYFACEYGETTEYIKEQIYKLKANRLLFLIKYENKKQGYFRTGLKSSADLTDAEMSLSIERFKIYASKEAGILLPASDQKEFLEHCISEIEKNKYYI